MSSYAFMVIIMEHLLSKQLDTGICYTKQLIILNIKFYALKITIALLALFSFLMVYPFQSTNFPGIIRWQEKPLNPGQRHMFDRQIDARFAVIA
jgi:hypothetical protein